MDFKKDQGTSAASDPFSQIANGGEGGEGQTPPPVASPPPPPSPPTSPLVIPTSPSSAAPSSPPSSPKDEIDEVLFAELHKEKEVGIPPSSKEIHFDSPPVTDSSMTSSSSSSSISSSSTPSISSTTSSPSSSPSPSPSPSPLPPSEEERDVGGGESSKREKTRPMDGGEGSDIIDRDILEKAIEDSFKGGDGQPGSDENSNVFDDKLEAGKRNCVMEMLYRIGPAQNPNAWGFAMCSVLLLADGLITFGGAGHFCERNDYSPDSDGIIPSPIEAPLECFVEQPAALQAGEAFLAVASALGATFFGGKGIIQGIRRCRSKLSGEVKYIQVDEEDGTDNGREIEMKNVVGEEDDAGAYDNPSEQHDREIDGKEEVDEEEGYGGEEGYGEEGEVVVVNKGEEGRTSPTPFG